MRESFVKMALREGAQLLVQPVRRVCLEVKGPLREELQRLVMAEIVRFVQEPTGWVRDLVVVQQTKTDHSAGLWAHDTSTRT